MRRLRALGRHARAAGAADRRRDRPRASATRCARPAWAAAAREAYIRILVTRGVGELSYDPAACPTPSIVVIVKPHVDPPARGVRARRQGGARVDSSATIPDSVNPLIKSNNLLNNALAMQEAFRRGAFEGVMRNYRGELAECTTVEPVHRQERRGADAAARRGPAAGHHPRVPVRGRRRRRHSGPRAACCATRICSAPTKRS